MLVFQFNRNIALGSGSNTTAMTSIAFPLLMHPFLAVSLSDEQ
jgi:hypothetical protein